MPLKTVANIGSLDAYKTLIKGDAKLVAASGVAFVSFTKFTFPDKTVSPVIFFGIIPPTCTAAVAKGGVGKATGTATINAADEIELEVAVGEVAYEALAGALVKCGVTRKLRIPLEAPKPGTGAAPKVAVKPATAPKGLVIGKKVAPPAMPAVPAVPGAAPAPKPATAAKTGVPTPGTAPAANAPAPKLANPKMPGMAVGTARLGKAPVPAKAAPTPANPTGAVPATPPATQPVATPPVRPTGASPQKPTAPAPAPAAKPSIKSAIKSVLPGAKSAKPPQKSPEEKTFRAIFTDLKKRYEDTLEFNPGASTETARLTFAKMMAAARGGNFAAAMLEAEKLHGELGKVRRAETTAQSKSRHEKGKKEKQQKRAARLQETFGAVKKSYFTKGSADNLEKGHPNAGPQFKAFLQAQREFETKRDAASLKALTAAATAYCKFFDEEVSEDDPNLTDHNRDNSACQTALKAARHYELAMTYEALPKPPWDEKTEMRAAEIYTKMIFEQEGGIPEMDESGNLVTADPKLASVQAGSNVNGTFWIEKNTWAEDNISSVKKTFIFKPLDAEGSVAGYPKGGSAAREMLGKSVSDQLNAQMGLDFDVPETTVVGVDASKMIDPKTTKPGAAGTVRTGSIQHFEKSRGELKDVIEKDPSILDTIPHEEVEKMAVLDLIQLNTDRHSGNFMVGDRDDGKGGKTTKLVPIDNGLCMPSIRGLQARRAMLGAPHAVLGKTSAAKQKMSPEMVAKIQALDADAVVDGTKKAFAALAELHPGAASASQITDENFQLTKRSILFLKKACTELTIEEVQDAYVSSLEEIFSSPDDAMDKNFAQAIQNVKDRREASKALAAINELELEAELVRLGWGVEGMGFRSWMQLNSVKVLKAYQGKIQNPAAVSRLAEMRKALKDHPDAQKTWGQGLGKDHDEIEKIFTTERNKRALAYGDKVATNMGGDRAEVIDELGGDAKLRQLDPQGAAKTSEAKANLIVAESLQQPGVADRLAIIKKKYTGTELKSPYQQFQALKALKEYESLGGDAAYSRAGGNGEIETIAVRLSELKLLGQINAA